MPLFIDLSGCLWAVRIRDKGVQSFRSLVKNKRRRLLVPFLLTALFWSIPLKYLSGYWHGSFIEIIRQIFLGQILMFGNFNSHLWFLQSLFFIFILAYIIEKSNLRQCPVQFMSSLLVLSMIARFLESRHICFLNIQSAFIYLLWFYIGFYFEHIRERANKLVDKHIGWWIIGVFIILYPFFVFLANKLPHGIGFGYITYYPKAVLGMAITYILCYKLNRITPPELLNIIKKLSGHSYGLYLYSDPVNYFIIYLISYYSLSDLFAFDSFTLSIYIGRFLITIITAIIVMKILNIRKIVHRV